MFTATIVRVKLNLFLLNEEELACKMLCVRFILGHCHLDGGHDRKVQKLLVFKMEGCVIGIVSFVTL